MPVPKRGSSKRKQESPPPSLPPASEDQLAEMYATPDMTQKGRNKNTATPVSHVVRRVYVARENCSIFRRA